MMFTKLRTLCVRHRIAVLILICLVAYNLFVYWYNSSTPITLGVWFPVSFGATGLVISETKSHRDDKDYWVKLLQTAPSKSFDKPELGDASELKDGDSLPQSFYFEGVRPPNNGIDYRESLMWDGTIVVRNNREFYSSLRINAAVDRLRELAPEELLAWFDGRANVLPPRRLDSIVYYSLGPGTDFTTTAAAHDTWERLSRARNPVYRLIALQSAHHWATSSDEIFDIYTRSLNEKNSVFHIQALLYIGHLAMAPSAERAREVGLPSSYVARFDVANQRFIELIHSFLQRPDLNPNDGTLEGTTDIRKIASETHRILVERMPLADSEDK